MQSNPGSIFFSVMIAGVLFVLPGVASAQYGGSGQGHFALMWNSTTDRTINALFENFLVNKRREWADYKADVTPFEIARYLVAELAAPN